MTPMSAPMSDDAPAEEAKVDDPAAADVGEQDTEGQAGQLSSEEADDGSNSIAC